MKVLRIPDEEKAKAKAKAKAKGMMWVIYPIIWDWAGLVRAIWDWGGVTIIGFAELQIKQGRN